MRVLITGSREPNRYKTSYQLEVYRALYLVCEEFDLFYPPDEYGNTMPDPAKITVIQGGCPTGADFYADQWCLHNFFTSEVHHAKWSEFGRRAGPIRNQHMVDLGADLCLAFIKDGSRGASMTAAMAEKAMIPTRRFAV